MGALASQFTATGKNPSIGAFQRPGAESQTKDVQQLQDSESTAPGQLSSSEVLNLNSSQLLNWLFMEPGRQNKRKKAAAELVLPYANPE